MVDESNLEREYVKLLSQLTKQTQLLEKTFSILEQKVFKTNTKFESQISAQEEWTKRVKSDNRTANLFSKVRIKELEQADDLYKVRMKEMKGRKDIAKILSSDKQARIADNRVRAKERENLEEIHQEGVKRNILMRKAMQGTTNKFDFITSSLTKGRGLIPTMSLLGKGAYNSAVSFKAMKSAQEEFKIASIQGDKTKINATRKTMIQAETDYEGKTAGSKNLKSISEKLANAGKFFENHMTGILIGAGAAGVLIGVIKKAVSVSPMFQQMMKLMNFAVTMILRPLGDFIGFFLRPILILLLRKFILPWFKASHGTLVAAGTAAGEVVVNWIDDLTSGDMTKMSTAIGKALIGAFGLALSLKAMKLLFSKASSAIIAPIIKIASPDWLGKLVIKMPLMPDWVKKLFNITPTSIIDDTNIDGGGNASDGIQTEDTSTPKSTKTTSGKAPWIGKDGKYNPNWNKNPTTPDIWNKNPTVEEPIKKTSSIKDNSIIKQLQDKFEQIKKKVTGRRFSLTSSISKAMNLGKSFFTGLPVGLAGSDAFDAIIDQGFRLVEGFSKLAGVHVDLPDRDKERANFGFDGFIDKPYAMGGIINEPVIGQGQNTGKSYKFGEAGREAVVPLNGGGMGGGTTVNINISNMSGDRQDVEKLRKTILEVLQQTSMSRVRA